MGQGMRRPYAGVRVLDFSGHIAGPAATKMLADYGAEIIIVESEVYLATSGGSRHVGPPGKSPVNTAYMHNSYNPNKLSATVNLTHAEGREVVKQLIAISDVIIFNRLPEFLKKYELTYEQVRELRPDIIYISMPTMGADGPRSFYKGVGWTIQAMAGLNALSGYADRPPASPSPSAYPDCSSNPLHTSVAILAALRYRSQTGQGQYVELSQHESTVCWTGEAVLQYTTNGTVKERSANRVREAAPHDVYRCHGEDRWCAISVSTDEQWRALCQIMGRCDLEDHPDYATLLGRKAHEDELRGIVEAWTSGRVAEDVMEMLQAAGVPCAALNDVERLVRQDPQLKERGLWSEVDHPELGKTLVESWGFRFMSLTPLARRAPLLGEHNDYVFLDLLGLAEEGVNAFIVEGIFR